MPDNNNIIKAFSNLENVTASTCVQVCDLLSNSVAIFSSIPKLSKNITNCTCVKSIWEIFYKMNDPKNPPTCSAQIHITPFGLSTCKHAAFLNPNQTKIPQVALISVPGSGNSWTRCLFQSLSGILSGSVYWSQQNFEMGLYGEMEPWNSRRTTFIKNHEWPEQLKDNVPMKGKFSIRTQKLLLLHKQPTPSPVPEKKRRN